MKTRYCALQKLLALALALVLVIGLLPNVQRPVSAAVQAVNKVADASTLNEWENYFGPDVLSTEFAGGVWTDKSVLIDASAFGTQITMDDPTNNFLIALSAIAANQQVTGYSNTPMDVMLTLDVSGSMDSGSKDSSMIAAANQAIGSLLSQNNNNRVGVVLYSGNSSTNQNAGTGTATVVLPLDHYTTTSTTSINSGNSQQTIPAYLSLTNNTVSVASGVRNSNNRRPNTDSKNVSGGTYIQNGLYKAWGEFAKVTDTKVPAGNAQAGAQRMPIMILMSDGQPTLATASYNNVGSSNSNYGNGSEESTSWQTVFLTQLTAAWVKGKMESHYGTTPKFYTLGLGTGNSNYATAVLNPSNAYSTLNNYWNRFFNNTTTNGNVNVGGNNSSWYLAKDSNVKDRDYVDQYWLATNASGLLDAFKSIVETIELDAAGHVTLVEPIGEDMSGYITFTDELGVMMEVKDLKGLLLGNQLFTGHEIAESLQNGSLGTIQSPTAYGNEFIATVRERLGITNASDAQALVSAAYADGQLAYDDKGTPNEADDSFSNYIGWYSNSAGDYLGFWDKDTGITAEGAPAGATWINKSYGYLGTAGSSDMMHVVVMLSTHIASGMQVVQYKIPASLIPKVTYTVELEGSDVTNMSSITRTGASPLRLVYEVGMRSDLNAINLAQKIEELPDSLHVHQNTDGTYSFYTNLWGSEDGDHEIDYNDPLGHQVAQSHFHPAVGNSRYYYTEDTPVYVKSGNSYSPYKGTSAPAGDGYYRAYHYYTASGYTTEYLPMSTYALNMAAANGRADDGGWYIPQGAIFQQIDRFRMEKALNATQTLEYYDYPVVVDAGAYYDVYAFLGNNGKVTVAPAQGIQLSKTVTETAAGAPDIFTFNITLSQAVANPAVTDPDGNAYTGNWSVNGNVITVELKDGDTVYITGLPAGVSYSVEEEASRYYSASSNNATGTVAAYTIHPVDFTNVPKSFGDLIISKDVDHPYTTIPQALTDKEFTINVTLSGPNTANKTFTVTGSDTISSVTTDANGTFSVVLKDNSSLTVVDLPEDTTFVATETLNPATHKGFYMDADRSTLTGTIAKDTAAQAHVVNVYAPSQPVASIDVSGTKTLVDEGGTFDWNGKSFTIRLEQYHPGTGTYTTIAETNVSEGNLSFEFKDTLEFNAIGTYYYKVSEVIPAERLEGMSYDATTGRFEVRVTDNDVNGELEFEVYNVDTGDQITGSEYTYTFTKNFVNTHTTDATFVEFAVNKNVVDPHNTGASEAGFLFELFPVENGVASTTAAYSMRTVLVDGNRGQALFHIPVTQVGTQTFLLKENAPLDADKIPGMIYDDSVYTVIVTTTAEDGELVPTVTFQKNGTDVAEADLVFSNVIDLEPLEMNPYIIKDLIGRDPLSDSEFTFHIQETDGSFVTPKAGGYSDTVSIGKGTAYFKDLIINTVGTYYFRTWEEAGTTKGMTYDSSIYHITVNVTVNASGKLEADYSFVRVGSGSEANNVTFVNNYTNSDTEELVLQGNKVLTGRTLITGEFQFVLEGPNGYTETVSNRADGSFVFSPITYTAADIGTHTYTITELNGGKGGVQYDNKTCTVTVTVADNGAGELVVTTSGADSIEFNNAYSTSSATVSFSGTKTLFNTDLEANNPLQGGEFTFELYASGADFSTEEYLVTDTTNNANGSFSFGLNYTVPGDYYYLLREKIEEAPGVGYDASIYQIKIAVYDNGQGELIGRVAQICKVGTNENTIAFGNYYTPAATEITINGEKELLSLLNRPLLDGEFDFELYAANAAFTTSGTALQSVTNENGQFSFAPITFSNSGTYYYVVKEAVPSAAVNDIYDGVVYDTSVFGITVTVTDNEQGQLEASYTVTKNGVAAELKFQNNYVITNYTSFSVSGIKTWLNTTLNAANPMAGGEFTFELYDINNIRIATVHNDANGNFTFQNIPVASVGEHKFTIKELNGNQSGIGYDNRVYTVTVWAQDDGSGNLVLSGPPVIKLNDQNADLKFENTYTVTQTTAQFQAQKVLNGKNLEEAQFFFGLFEVDANGNTSLLQSAENLASGSIVFDEITYTTPGDYRYIIREAIPLDAVNNVKDGITYDTHVCEILVSVGDNGDGTLSADVTYETQPLFTNVYNVSGETTVDISGQKNLIGKNLEAGLYSFTLYKDDQVLATVQNAASGRFVFENVPLDSMGEHTFTVKEVKGDLSGITYDETVYTVIVTVTDNGLGGLKASAPVVMLNNVATDLVFTNRYVNNGTGYVAVGGTKYFTQNGASKPIAHGQFAFHLSGPTVSETVYANPNGTFSFSPLNFSANDIGHTYTYTVKEMIPTGAGSANIKDGIVYDSTVYTFTVQVEDDHEGGINIIKKIGQQEIAGDIQVQFSNTYNIQGNGFATIGGTKTYTDSRTHAALPFNAGEFHFNLKGHGIDETVTNKADGSFSFSQIIYTKDHIADTPYIYTVSEVKGNKAYINYDEALFTVEVMVKDDGKGGLNVTQTIKKNGTPVDAIAFANTYNIVNGGSVSIDGLKNYTKPLIGGDFSFILFQGTDKIEEVKNAADGTFSFTDLTYGKDDIGQTYTYTVQEFIPADAEKQTDGTYLKDGVTYDPDVYTIKITVEDNGQGGLNITKTVNAVKVNDIRVIFNNYYDITCTGKLELTGTKALTGSKLEDGDFSFGLYDAEGKLVVDPVANKDGKFTISIAYNKTQIPGSPYTYTLKEIIPAEAVKNADGTYTLNGITYDATVYTVTVTLSDDGKGGLNVNYTVNGSADTAISFTNTYKANPATLALEATKSYNKPLKGDDFSFLLEGAIGNSEISQVKKNDKDGKILFDELTFSEAGSYTFRVTETDKILGFIEYDKSVYNVVVVVADKGNGQLEISNLTVNTVKDGKISFSNTYVIDGVGSVTVDGQKLYNKDLVGGEFAFNLSGNGVNETVKNGKDGKFTFSELSYDKDDVGNTYVYTVSEIKGDKDYITYDETLFTVEVAVADDEEGGLKITRTIKKADTIVDAITFTNTYSVTGTGSAAISGQKLYNKDLVGGEFAFNLSGHGINETVANTADGKFSFSRIPYTAADIGQIYTYIVSEVKGGKDYITYDETLFTVEVKVEDNGEGGLTVTQTYKKDAALAEAITFTNVYANNGTGSVAINGVKTYTKDLLGGDFSFILFQGTDKIEEVKNAADGAFSFTELSYTAADIGQTYTYTVQEAIPADAVKQADGTYLKNGVTYDPDIYTITVTVEDNGEGGLKITKKLGITETDEIVVEFNNAYDITGTGKLELTGTKELTGGKPLADGEFSFGLYDAEGNPVVKPVTNADGKFTFTVEYDKDSISAEPIIYTVKEIIPADATKNADGTYTLNHITYDTTVYQVAVTVSDNGQGGIHVDYELVNAEAITFKNIYTPANHIVNLNVQKIVVSKTEDSIAPEGFQFELYYQDLLLASYASNAEGKAIFPVAFTAKDIGQTFSFQIKEVNTQLVGVTYDDTVYDITVTIGQNEDGTINSHINDVLSDTVTVEFTNTYAKPTNPNTGDTTNLALLFVLLLISGTGLTTIIADRKKRRA